MTLPFWPNIVPFILPLIPHLTNPLLNPDCSPGGNFDLRRWDLEISSCTGNNTQLVKSTSLQGCTGFTGTTFFTDSETGEMVLTSPDSQSTTRDSNESINACGTELREVNVLDGKPIAWCPSEENVLKVTMTVTELNEGKPGIIIGQVVAAEPVATIHYDPDGRISVSVLSDQQTERRVTYVGRVPVGTQFTYALSYSESLLPVSVNGVRKLLSIYGWDLPPSYFKVGDPNIEKVQKGSKVRIAGVNMTHKRRWGSRPARNGLCRAPAPGLSGVEFGQHGLGSCRLANCEEDGEDNATQIRLL